MWRSSIGLAGLQDIHVCTLYIYSRQAQGSYGVPASNNPCTSTKISDLFYLRHGGPFVLFEQGDLSVAQILRYFKCTFYKVLCTCTALCITLKTYSAAIHINWNSGATCMLRASNRIMIQYSGTCLIGLYNYTAAPLFDFICIAAEWVSKMIHSRNN